MRDGKDRLLAGRIDRCLGAAAISGKFQMGSFIVRAYQQGTKLRLELFGFRRSGLILECLCILPDFQHNRSRKLPSAFLDPESLGSH
jgi:hypothetical protein